LALFKLANKTQTNIEQVQKSLNRLSAKNLIRKIYVQSKVGFELTPKGKTAIEVLAKARADRITQQLQQSIHLERKTKLRNSTVKKMLVLEGKWQTCQMPDKQVMGEIEQKVMNLLAETKEYERNQPLCHVDPQNYLRIFTEYKPQIDGLTIQNSNLTKAVGNYAKIKDYQLLMSSDIETIKKTIKRYDSIPEAAPQISQLKLALTKLKLIQSRLENYDKQLLSQFEGFKIQLADNSRLIESLRKSTHKFTPIKREHSIDKTAWQVDPEGPTITERTTGAYPLEEKCIKCGTKQKFAPVDIG
jgi:DNA-binding MarR family transcriptional regulator